MPRAFDAGVGYADHDLTLTIEGGIHWLWFMVLQLTGHCFVLTQLCCILALVLHAGLCWS